MMDANDISDSSFVPSPHAQSAMLSLEFNEFSSHGVEFDGSAENPLFNLSQPIFLYIVGIKRLPAPENLLEFNDTLKQSIINVSKKCHQQGYSSALIDKLCCLHCIALDEFILHTVWGQQKGWENRTLLSQLFGLRNGGELFFEIMNMALKQPDRTHDFLEVIHFYFLSGFQGRYRDSSPHQLYPIIQKLKNVLHVDDVKQQNMSLCTTRLASTSLNKLPSGGLNLFALNFTIIFSIGIILLALNYGFHETSTLRATPFSELAKNIHLPDQKHLDLTYDSSLDDMIPTPASATQRRPSYQANIKPKKMSIITAKPVQKTKKLYPPSNSQSTGARAYWVQIASYSNRKYAEDGISNYAAPPYPLHIAPSGRYFVIYIAAPDRKRAENIQLAWQNKYSERPIVIHKRALPIDKPTTIRQKQQIIISNGTDLP